MSKIGIYYAYWTHEWDADFVPFVARVKSLGFDVLEVNSGTIERMDGSERSRLARVAADAGILLSYCIGLPPELDVSAPEERTRNAGVRFLESSVRAIGEMGGGNLSGIIYGAWPSTFQGTDADRLRYLERSIESIRKVAKTAETSGVFLNVEVVNRFEQFMMNTSREGLEYVRSVGSPNVRILLDTFHMNIEEDSIGDAIRLAGAHLGHFHIGENNRRQPGHGRIPWNEIAVALNDISYDGFVVMEPFVMPGGTVGRDIRVFRDLRHGLDLDDEARRAQEFIRGVLRSAAPASGAPASDGATSKHTANRKHRPS